MYDLDGLSMVGRAWNLAMYTLAEEEFHPAEDKGCVIDRIKLNTSQTVRKLSSKTLYCF
jgi:hypothetical protein